MLSQQVEHSGRNNTSDKEQRKIVVYELLQWPRHTKLMVPVESQQFVAMFWMLVKTEKNMMELLRVILALQGA